MTAPRSLEEKNATEHKRYGRFLKKVISSEKLWAVWCGDTWATADDPTGHRRALFLLWPSKKEASKSLKANREKFPEDAEIDYIDLEKWIEIYTPDLIKEGAFPFLCPDMDLNGLTVDPADLRRDMQSMMYKSELQGSDLVELRRRVKRTKE